MIACNFVSALNLLLFATLVKLTEEMIAVIHKKKNSGEKLGSEIPWV